MVNESFYAHPPVRSVDVFKGESVGSYLACVEAERRSPSVIKSSRTDVVSLFVTSALGGVDHHVIFFVWLSLC